MTSKLELLTNWVAETAKNGIRQHEPAWHAARTFTISGSNIATVQGTNPYESVTKLLSEKAGIYGGPDRATNGCTAKRWGSTFEPILRNYVESDLKCKVIGSDLYIRGEAPRQSMAYSPDGLAIIDAPPLGPRIVLLEFKCPISRMPSGGVPKYYLPQIKMGLDMIPAAESGLFIEGVFRRCTWGQFMATPDCDINNGGPPRAKAPATWKSQPLAYGVIGIHATSAPVIAFCKQYTEQYEEWGDDTNGYLCNDLGESPPALFDLLMSGLESGQFAVWYPDVVWHTDPATARRDADALETHCKNSKLINLGVLPWKLFAVHYSDVEKEPGYLLPWVDKANAVVDVVKRCHDPSNASFKQAIINNYVVAAAAPTFSDEM